MDNIWLITKIALSVAAPLLLYLRFNKAARKKASCSSSMHELPSIYFLLKRWLAEFFLRMRRKKAVTSINCRNNKPETPRIKNKNSTNSMLFYGADQKGNTLLIKFAHRGFKTVEVTLHLATNDGRLYVLPGYPDTTMASSSNQKWSTAGLKIELLQEHQRWRIIYNGMLRNLNQGDECNDENVQHVRLNCIFITDAIPQRWPEDWSPKLHADVLAREPWRSPEWMNKIRQLDYTGTDYIGSLIGEVKYNDGTTSTLFLRGLHQHRWGNHESYEFNKSVTLFGTMMYGALFYLDTSSTKHCFPTIKYGQFRDNNEETLEIERMGFRLSDFAQKELTSSSEHNIWFTARGKDYNILVKLNESVTFCYGQPWDWESKIISVKLELNGRPGVGLLQLCNSYNGPSQKPRKLQYLKQLHVHVEMSNYVLRFDDEKCQSENIVGGKGFSLAVLTSIKDADFVVPKAFCVTVFGLELQLRAHKSLQKAIEDLEHVSVGKKDGDLQEYCDRAVQIIQSTPVVNEVRESILKAINDLEAEEGGNKPHKYAVRSSAVGEDSEETSAAGQNSTYLGIQGADNIVQSVAKCWASLFSYQSVKYRKQYSMFIKSSMGVCVQQMVDAEAAGVMFTRHPTTGDPSNILITGNYGLGETVVSAAVEPDTIIVHKSWDDKLTVKSSTPGNKQQKMVISDDGLIAVDLSEQESKEVCVSKEIALRLAAIGVYLENLFVSARDIEWATVGDQIYLLQARPITSLYTWTDFELTHELDTAVPSDVDILTLANFNEVLPYPVSPLTISLLKHHFNDIANHINGSFDRNMLNVVACRCMLNYSNMFLKNADQNISLMNKVCDMAISGHIVISPEIHKIGLERNGEITPYSRLHQIYKLFVVAFRSDAIEKAAKQLHDSIVLNPEDFYTAYSLYNEISKHFSEYHEILDFHATLTSANVAYQIFAMALLTSGYDDLVPDHLSDIALLLGSANDLISGQIVTGLKKILKYLKKYEVDQEFQKLNPTKAIDWLKINCPPAAKEFENVLREHGYRSIQELDFIAEPWLLRPEDLIVTLQTITSADELDKSKQQLTTEETVALLKTPKSRIIRWILKKIIPLCRKSIVRRELTKARLVFVVHKIRMAYRRLEKLMILEEYLPSENLIFFFTHEELGKMLNYRSTSLVQKAIRRRRLYPHLKQLEYSELNTGMPFPIKDDSEIERLVTTDGSIKIQGTPICGGSVLNRACVITNLSDTHKIRNGDILITRTTDIAWSPFFALLSGIVTELGGLVSHGAVIAREYGLPCIVGTNHATRLFKTGDTVLLVADTGVLQLVERPEEKEETGTTK